MATATPKPPSRSAVTPDRLSDRALFARAANDESAFAELVNRYREPLRRHAARYVGDADAEDVVQQALVNASLALRREPDRDIEPKPWLYKVTTNAAIDHRRAQSVRPLGDRPHEEIDLDAVSQAPGADPHDVVTGRESVRGVVAGIQGLSENQRRAATARFLEGRSHDEIAADIGVSKGAARELIHRARRNLREAIPALSPIPLFNKLRESLTALFAGGGSAGAAKVTAGAVAVVVAAGAGGVAIKKATDGGQPASPAGAKEAAAPVTTIPEASHVAQKPKPVDGGGQSAKGNRDGGGDSGGGSASGGANGGGAGADAAAPAAASAPSGATTTASSTAAGGDTGGSANPVQDAVDQLPVDDVSSGVDQVTDTVNGVTEGLGTGVGVDAPSLPDLPNVGEALGGGN